MPHAVFTTGENGVLMSPFQDKSLGGDLQKTHSEIIKMQNSMIERKKLKLREKSL